MKKPRRKKADLPSAWKRIDLLTAIDREIVLNATLKGAHLMANRKASAEWAHYRLCALGAARRVLLSDIAPAGWPEGMMPPPPKPQPKPEPGKDDCQ